MGIHIPSLKELERMVGAELAGMIDPSTLALVVSDVNNSGTYVTRHELAIARALLFTVSGSALMDGDKKAILDAPVLYRMVSTANNLLIGAIK